MNYYITVTDWPDWLMSDDYHGNDLRTPKPRMIIQQAVFKGHSARTMFLSRSRLP